MKPADLVLSIDLGSSWCKAAYLDRDGRLVAEGRVFSRSITERESYQPEQFWDAVSRAVRLANMDLEHAPVPAAIGISCRGMFGLCLERDGRAFFPSAQLLGLKGAPDVVAAYRSPVWGEDGPYEYGYAVRLAGLIAGMKRLTPDEWQEIHRVGALRDYLVYRLCGQWVTDPSTGPNSREWPAGLMDISGLPLEAFPEIREPWDIVDQLTSEAAEELQLPLETPVVTGLHDGAAANIGTGAIHRGDACMTLGTNFAIRVVSGERPKTDCFGYLVAPGQWAWVNNVTQAATQLDLVSMALMDATSAEVISHAQLEAKAALVRQDRRLPHLPLGDHAALLGAVHAAIREGFSVGEIYLATLHELSLKVHELFDSARSDGAVATRIVATGGGARNQLLLDVLSETLGLQVESGSPEAGLLGAGMAAAIGAGWYPCLSEAWAHMGMSTPNDDASSCANHKEKAVNR